MNSNEILWPIKYSIVKVDTQRFGHDTLKKFRDYEKVRKEG